MKRGKIHAKNLWKKDITKNVHIFVLNFDFITRNIAQIQFFWMCCHMLFFVFGRIRRSRPCETLEKRLTGCPWDIRYQEILDFSCQKGQWNFNIFYTQSYLQPHRMNQPIYSKINSGRFSYNWKNDSWKLQFTKHKH